MSQASSPSVSGRWNIPEAVASWFVPGLGHYLLGQKKRGRILCLSIMALWILGLLIGGIGVFDSQSPSAPIIRKAFYGMGLSMGMDMVRAGWFAPVNLTFDQDGAAVRSATPAPSYDEFQIGQARRIAYLPPLNRADEQGVLFVAVAGLLNAMLIIDVIHRPARTREETDA